MSDIVTRLLLKTNDFDANLNKSKKNVNGFQSDISKMSGSYEVRRGSWYCRNCLGRFQ